MTYKELYEKAIWLLEHNEIDGKEYDNMTEPLNAEVGNAEPVRHGAWLPCDKKGYILTEMALRDGRRWYGYKCSECNNIYHGNAFTKYCPNCGAKMDGERKEECGHQ